MLTRFSECVERASVDEAYIDLTQEVEKRLASYDDNSAPICHTMLPNTYIEGWEGPTDSTQDGATVQGNHHSQPRW